MAEDTKIFEMGLNKKPVVVPKQTKILIGIPENRGFVPVEFMISILGLQRPKNVIVNHMVVDGMHQAAMRNDLATTAVENDADYVFMCDDDMLYLPDTLIRLLDADKDVICGFAVTPNAPHNPVYGRAPSPTEEYPGPDLDPFTYDMVWPTDTGKKDGKVKRGPQKSWIVGGAGLLIKTSVLKQLDTPWFSFSGTTGDGRGVGEDVWFSRLCRDAGIELWIHTDVIVQHLVTMTVIPKHTKLEWGVHYIPRWEEKEDKRRLKEARDNAAAEATKQTIKNAAVAPQVSGDKPLRMK